MNRTSYCILTFFMITVVYAQDSTNVDAKYREDQFYIGATYGVLTDQPNEVSQNGFSGGAIVGFIRDFPINKNRTFAIGLGVGYSGSSYNQNLFIPRNTNDGFQILENDDFSKNRFSTHLIEVPFEFRWRNSAPDDYKFWRIYAGFKVGYLLASTSRFESTQTDTRFNSTDNFERLQYGVTLSTGYNVWNVYVYYGLNSIFDNQANVNGITIDTRIINAGLIFYLL